MIADCVGEEYPHCPQQSQCQANALYSKSHGNRNQIIKKRSNYSKAELDWTQSNDEDAKEDGDGIVADDLSGGHDAAGLPGAHPVPAAGVQKWLPKVSPLLFISETHGSSLSAVGFNQ